MIVEKKSWTNKSLDQTPITVVPPVFHFGATPAGTDQTLISSRIKRAFADPKKQVEGYRIPRRWRAER
jgi:hypothetical protein